MAQKGLAKGVHIKVRKFRNVHTFLLKIVFIIEFTFWTKISDVMADVEQYTKEKIRAVQLTAYKGQAAKVEKEISDALDTKDADVSILQELKTSYLEKVVKIKEIDETYEGSQKLLALVDAKLEAPAVSSTKDEVNVTEEVEGNHKVKDETKDDRPTDAVFNYYFVSFISLIVCYTITNTIKYFSN